MSDIKLTDEVLDGRRKVLSESDTFYLHYPCDTYIAAIRALRDAARAVVEAEKQGIWIVVERRIGDLEELLPDSEVKP